MKKETFKFAANYTYINFQSKSKEIGTFGWDEKHHGKPTVQNLERYRSAFNESMKPGGANAHLAAGYSPMGTIWVKNQKTGKEVARFNPPMFELI